MPLIDSFPPFCCASLHIFVLIYMHAFLYKSKTTLSILVRNLFRLTACHGECSWTAHSDLLCSCFNSCRVLCSINVPSFIYPGPTDGHLVCNPHVSQVSYNGKKSFAYTFCKSLPCTCKSFGKEIVN